MPVTPKASKTRKGPARIPSGSLSATKQPSFPRRWPIGAEVQPGGGVHFRVWAPRAKAVAAELSEQPQPRGGAAWVKELTPEPSGYFSGLIDEAQAGRLYRFRLDTGCFPDPASRFQPDGPHGPSQVIDPAQFHWTDSGWPGLALHGQIIYELHIGTFTNPGTWQNALEQLPELKALGVTAIEVMPVADFPGRFGWGYDGVNLFAPTRLYGQPDDFRAFVDGAHRLGLGIILDVVYNHIGPDGNYFKQFSEDYFTDRYANEWGEAINFDGHNSGPVREFFITNAACWISEYHVDGLRLDATHAIFDHSSEHILAAIARAARQAAGNRRVLVIAENEAQKTRIIRPPQNGGYGCDAMWNDDFHHSARVALTGHNEAFLSGYRGAPQEFISAVKWGFLYQGQWHPGQKKRRGTPAFGLHPAQFVIFLENHDQVSYSLRGLRLHALCSAGQLRALTALLLLGPATPLLFQGQEFASSKPFVFFADHNPELARLVAKGRRQLLNQFPSIAAAECDPVFPDPGDPETFRRCVLDFSERQTHPEVYALYCDLLRLRREDPVFANPQAGGVDGAVLGPEAFVLRFLRENGNDRLLLVNLGLDLRLENVPEPLLAPPSGRAWRLKWSSESPRYGGNGTPPVNFEGNWSIPGHAALVFAAEQQETA